MGEGGRRTLSSFGSMIAGPWCVFAVELAFTSATLATRSALITFDTSDIAVFVASDET